MPAARPPKQKQKPKPRKRRAGPHGGGPDNNNHKRHASASAQAAASTAPPPRHCHRPQEAAEGRQGGAGGAAMAAGSIAAGQRYLAAVGIRDDKLLTACHGWVEAQTTRHAGGPAGKTLATDCIAFAQLLAKATKSARVLQADGRTGYGSVGLALALTAATDDEGCSQAAGLLTIIEPDAALGRLVASGELFTQFELNVGCKVEGSWESGVEHTVEQGLRALVPSAAGSYDMVTLTAAGTTAKQLAGRWDLGLALLRPGGILLLHDAMLPPATAGVDGCGEAARAERAAFHGRLRADEARLAATALLAVGADGLLAAVKSRHR
eukprot:SAG22_NODE_130_length_18670_cov_12.091379_22_plen_322_part_01